MKLRLLLFNAILLICFSAQGQNYQDCSNPYPICDLKSYHFEEMSGQGDLQDELPELRCISNQKFKETNSKWLSFAVSEPGTLVFNIEAMSEGDDIDFILFKKGSDCTDLKEVRCMTSGNDMINKRNTTTKCIGNTGLSYTSLDDFEKSGCKYSDDNYLKFLSVNQGEKYVLLVNNYDSESGFSISFNGDCTLREADNCILKDLNLNIVKLFPNPTSNSLVTEINSISESFTLQILDTTGRLIKEVKGSCELGLQSLNVDVSHLLSGMYILQVSQSELSASKTFVKEN